MGSPTQRSLTKLRHEGYSACVVEKWLAPARRRVDAFGFGDILAVHPAHRCALLVQTTTRDHQADRLAKIYATPDARAWLLAGNRIEVHGTG